MALVHANVAQAADARVSGRLVGHESCRDCHVSEVAAWEHSTHSTKAMAIIDATSRDFHPEAESIASALDIAKSDIAENERCARCHDTRQSGHGAAISLAGVSCESCHGGAGPVNGHEGWLEIHSVADDTKSFGDTDSIAARQARIDQCEALGMIRTSNTYQLAKACYQCHVVNDPPTVAAGHPVGNLGFEFVEWFQGEVRHNFKLNQQVNAEVSSLWIRSHARIPKQHTRAVRKSSNYLIGQLVDLEISLRNRAASSGTGNFATAAATRVAAACGRLARIHDASRNSSAKAALDQVSHIYPALFDFSSDRHRASMTMVADEVSEIAKHCSRNPDTAELKAIEPLLPTTARGVPFDVTGGLFEVDAEQRHRPERIPPSATRDNETLNTPLWVDPARVAGPEKCIDCHQSEYIAWNRSSHATKAFDQLRTNPRSIEYARNLGIAARKITTDSICLNCHATPRAGRFGENAHVSGVSCESCHGDSGGKGGWLSFHGVYGTARTMRHEESWEHYRARRHAVRRAGMLGSHDLYELAKRCYQCHVVSNETVVAAGGHSTGQFQFEWVEWLRGEVRHNYQRDQSINSSAPLSWTHPVWNASARPTSLTARTRLLRVVGQLVDIELGLRNRWRATTDAFAYSAAGRVAAASAKLASIRSGDSLGELDSVLDRIAAIVPDLFAPPSPPNAPDEWLVLANALSARTKSLVAAGGRIDLPGVDGE